VAVVTFKSAWLIQGLKLTLANSQNASDFDTLRARKMPTNRCLQVRIIHFSQTFGSHQFASGKNVTSKSLQVD